MPTTADPPSPVLRLLALADQFTQFDDQLARLQPAYAATQGHSSANSKVETGAAGLSDPAILTEQSS